MTVGRGTMVVAKELVAVGGATATGDDRVTGVTGVRGMRGMRGVTGAAVAADLPPTSAASAAFRARFFFCPLVRFRCRSAASAASASRAVRT